MGFGQQCKCSVGVVGGRWKFVLVVGNIQMSSSVSAQARSATSQHFASTKAPAGESPAEHMRLSDMHVLVVEPSGVK